MAMKEKKNSREKWPSRLGLQNTKYISSNEGPGYDTKQSDGEALVMLELSGM